MKLMCVGTGYISSEIARDKIKTTNGEIDTCYFQFANYKYTDSNEKKHYSYFLCQAIGNLATLIINNFIKGSKVFIRGDLEQKNIIKTSNESNNKEYSNVTILKLDWIEFMIKSNENIVSLNEYKKNNNENIEETLQNKNILNIEKDINNEAFE